MEKKELRFKVKSALDKIIRVTEEYWEVITEIKHPIMKNYEQEVKYALKNPDKVRRSRKDEKVFLYYKREDKYFICVLAKHLNGEGFIISAYLADKIKKGETVWPKK